MISSWTFAFGEWIRLCTYDSPINHPLKIAGERGSRKRFRSVCDRNQRSRDGRFHFFQIIRATVNHFFGHYVIEDADLLPKRVNSMARGQLDVVLRRLRNSLVAK